MFLCILRYHRLQKVGNLIMPCKIPSVGQIHMYASQVFKEKESPECIVMGSVKIKKIEDGREGER